jgi:hypothetical protein
MSADPLATLASTDTIGANPIAVVVGAHLIFGIRLATPDTIVLYYIIIFIIRHVISPP